MFISNMSMVVRLHPQHIGISTSTRQAPRLPIRHTTLGLLSSCPINNASSFHQEPFRFLTPFCSQCFDNPLHSTFLNFHTSSIFRQCFLGLDRIIHALVAPLLSDNRSLLRSDNKLSSYPRRYMLKPSGLISRSCISSFHKKSTLPDKGEWQADEYVWDRLAGGG